jgi:hypothetical protein
MTRAAFLTALIAGRSTQAPEQRRPIRERQRDGDARACLGDSTSPKLSFACGMRRLLHQSGGWRGDRTVRGAQAAANSH